jgi:hypothetical protein
MRHSRLRKLVTQVVFPFLSLGLAFASATPALAQGRGCGQPFVAERRLPGDWITIPSTNVQMVMPRGWTGSYVMGNDRLPVYRVVGPGLDPRFPIALLHRPLGLFDNFKSIDTLLSENVAAFVGNDAVQEVKKRTFALGGNCGGRALVRGSNLEGNLTIVRGDGWLYAVLATYPPQNAGLMRAAIDTMVASASLSPPPADVAVSPPPRQPPPRQNSAPKRSRYIEDEVFERHGVDLTYIPAYK